ncbi:putative reverse transcriptase/RNA-dependent DNA polymerase [Citrus sinensis]|uniref:Reverse transcriptase/RNA-dependent DNA polymerase n=1 Tax=Citrus sinensis TaxID=2711 RepID=A0ACB8L5Q1_CITSI|nr:putative reverse transcriptase/RNA-dependent DNA polymerase [Citrus sinensis]
MWRVIKNILPTAENLWKRKSLQDPICQRCKKEVETIKHVLVECKAARKVWELAQLPMQSHSEQSQDFLSTVQDLCSRARKREAELMVVYCWMIWFARNNFIFEGKKLEPRISAAKVESILEAYQRVRKAESAKVSPDKRANQQRWKPPSENVLKLNVDAAINNKDQVTGLGAVIRNSDGLVIAAGIKQAQLREGGQLCRSRSHSMGVAGG